MYTTVLFYTALYVTGMCMLPRGAHAVLLGLDTCANKGDLRTSAPERVVGLSNHAIVRQRCELPYTNNNNNNVTKVVQEQALEP